MGIHRIDPQVHGPPMPQGERELDHLRPRGIVWGVRTLRQAQQAVAQS